MPKRTDIGANKRTTCVPQNMRLSTSRPKWSVPSQWSSEGDSSLEPSNPVGEYGDMIGAAMAIKTQKRLWLRQSSRYWNGRVQRSSFVARRLQTTPIGTNHSLFADRESAMLEPPRVTMNSNRRSWLWFLS